MRSDYDCLYLSSRFRVIRDHLCDSVLDFADFTLGTTNFYNTYRAKKLYLAKPTTRSDKSNFTNPRFLKNLSFRKSKRIFTIKYRFSVNNTLRSQYLT